MAQQTITQEGAFTRQTKDKINDNFTELYGTQAGGTLADAKILVGDASDLAAAVDMSGDAEIDNTGAVTVTGVNGAALTGDGADIQAALDLIAGISTVNVASPEIWNDNGTLKVGTA